MIWDVQNCFNALCHSDSIGGIIDVWSVAFSRQLWFLQWNSIFLSVLMRSTNALNVLTPEPADGETAFIAAFISKSIN